MCRKWPAPPCKSTTSNESALFFVKKLHQEQTWWSDQTHGVWRACANTQRPFRNTWVPQRRTSAWCTMLATKNGSHCCSNTNRCSGRQVHIDMWWLRMCLTQSTMGANKSNKQVKIWQALSELEDLYSAWLVLYSSQLIDRLSKDLSTPDWSRLEQFRPSSRSRTLWPLGLQKEDMKFTWAKPAKLLRSMKFAK